jgi:diacylglycerol kinase family enzyme
MRTAVVMNPSRVGDAEPVRTALCSAVAAHGWPEPLWLETTAEDPGFGQARQAVAAGVEVVFVYGGDGTVRACASELAHTVVALAILPAGTGNLVAANLGLPTDVDGCVAVVRAGRRRRIDLGCLDDMSFVLMAGIGFDAAMMAATPAPLKRRIGWPAYLLGGARRLFDRPMHLRISLDGAAPIERSARTVLVANLGRLQGGVDLFGDAQPDDGLLDVAVIGPRNPTQWLALAASVLLRRTPRRRQLETFRVSSVDVQSHRAEPRELDGDPIGVGTRLQVSIQPGVLWVCVP